MSRGADLDHPDDIKVAVQRATEALSAMTEKDDCTQNYTVCYTKKAARNPT